MLNTTKQIHLANATVEIRRWRWFSVNPKIILLFPFRTPKTQLSFLLVENWNYFRKIFKILFKLKNPRLVKRRKRNAFKHFWITFDQWTPAKLDQNFKTGYVIKTKEIFSIKVNKAIKNPKKKGIMNVVTPVRDCWWETKTWPPIYICVHHNRLALKINTQHKISKE